MDSDSEDEQVCVSSEELRRAYAEIDTYREQRVDIEMNLLKYWEKKKFLWSSLRELAVVHAVPATQVSVERVFSALRLVLSDLRCNLSDDILKTIMFIKLNQCKCMFF